MVDPKTYQQLIGTMKNTIDDGDLMGFATGHNIHIEFVNTFVAYLLTKISTGSEVFNKADITDMLAGTYDADSLINVSDASGHASVTSGWAFFQYKGGGTGNITNYQLLFKQENLAQEVSVDNSAGFISTNLQALADELYAKIIDIAVNTLLGDTDFSSTTTFPPASNTWRINNADPTLATQIEIDDTVGGNDVSDFLLSVQDGGWLNFTLDASNKWSFQVSNVSDQTGSIRFDVIGYLIQGTISDTNTTSLRVDRSGSTSIPDATESIKGKIQLADQTETNTGTNDTKAVTPLKRAVAWLNDVANTVVSGLTTTATNIVGAINELVTSVAKKQSKDTGAVNGNIGEFLSEETVDSGKSWGTLSDGQNAVANKILDAELIQQAWEYWLANFIHASLDTTAKEIIPAINELNAVGTSIFKSHTFVATNGQTDFVIPGAGANEIYKVIRVVIRRGTDPAIEQYSFISNFQIITTTVALDTVRIFPDVGEELSAGDLLHIDYFNKASIIAVETKLSLSSSNKDMHVASDITGENAPTGLFISQTPIGNVMASVGGQLWSLGDGVKTKAGYYSADGGTTAKAMNAIVAGDQFCWNTSVGGPILTTFDINFIYAT